MNLHPGKLLATAILLRENHNFDYARNNARFLLQGSKATKDPVLNDFVRNIFVTAPAYWNQLANLTKFRNEFGDWLNGASNKVVGLENYEPDFSAGTTQAFDSFYFRHRTKRFRCLIGEYFYHIKTWESNSVDWKYVDAENPLQPGDAFILSVPFCDTGSIPDNYLDLLEECNKLGIPVLLDLCYYPLLGGKTIDVTAECIDTVSFSLSKAFPVPTLRIGVRYTRKGTFDGQKLHDTISYNNTFSAYVGYRIINGFPVDFMYNKYRNKQIQFCEYAKLTPGDSVAFATGDEKWDMYSRRNLLNAYKLVGDPKMFKNRIFLFPVYENWDIFEAMKDGV